MRRLLLLTFPLALAGCAGAAHHAAQARRTAQTRKEHRIPKARPTRRRIASSPAGRVFGLPPVRRGPVPGYVLIADRNNNRLLVVSPSKRVVWRFPGANATGGTFRDPDDAFFTPGYREIVVNEEFNDTVARIDTATRRIVWSYGRAGVAGSAAGELSNPDDAYALPNGDVRVADIQNCRVVQLSPSHRIVAQVGTAGACAHDPPHTLLSPNGDTPLPDGGMLVTEIGGYVDRFDRGGRLVYSVRTPTSYPSDAQLLPNGNILVAGFDTPGRIDELTPGGRVVWTYGPPSGPGSLDRPSLAVRWPNGMIAATDDWHHRIVVIAPRTKRIVWQYGHFDVASSAPGYLSKPDGLDLLPAGRTSRHAAHAAHPVAHAAHPVATVHVRRVGSLPHAASRMAAVPLPGGRLLAAGGLVGASSSSQILAGSPASLRQIGALAVPTHDAAAATVGRYVYVFGGGQSSSTDRVTRIDPRTGRSTAAGSIGEPLSDLGAAVVDGKAYLVGGYTGSQFATAILRAPGFHVVARLPQGLRYAGATGFDGRIYVAGGLTTSGESRAVYAVDVAARTVRQIGLLPRPVAHAAMAAAGGKLYLIGGATDAGAPVASIIRIDPGTGRVAQVGRLPRPLADPATVTVGGAIYVLGGAGGSASRSVFKLSP